MLDLRSVAVKSFLLFLTASSLVAADKIAFGTYQLEGGSLISTMWIDGHDDVCNVQVAEQGWSLTCPGDGFLNECTINSNPCGHKFTLSNGKSYRMEGCGGSGFALYYYNSGTYIGTANYAPWYSECGDDQGNHQVHKTWEFHCDKPGC